jgi:hypothetical protein
MTSVDDSTTGQGGRLSGSTNEQAVNAKITISWARRWTDFDKSVYIEHKQNLYECTDKPGGCCFTGADPNRDPAHECACQKRWLNRSHLPVGCDFACTAKKLNTKEKCAALGYLKNESTVFRPEAGDIPCSQALAIKNDPYNYIISADTRAAIISQCIPTNRLQCCKGVPDEVNSVTSCGGVWGPKDTDGECDSFMRSWCLNNKTDTACGCYNSIFFNESRVEASFPHCLDPKCMDSAAYQLSYMKRPEGTCRVESSVCNQLIEIGALSDDNIIKDVAQYQECKDFLAVNGVELTDNNEPADKESEKNAKKLLSKSLSTTNLIFIILAVVSVICFIGTGIFFILQSIKAKKQTRQFQQYIYNQFLQSQRASMLASKPAVLTQPVRGKLIQ